MGNVHPRFRTFLQGCYYHAFGRVLKHPTMPAGIQCGYVMRGGSLGVHTMHCFDTTLRRVRLLCRMTRAQALPASSWLFPPR